MLNNNDTKINKDSFITKSAINSKMVVLSPYNRQVNIKSVSDLKNYNVVTIKNSVICNVCLITESNK